MKTTHHLLPYEQRLIPWQLRRWRAGSRFDIAQTERDHGPESVRLIAAYSVGWTLAGVIGFGGVLIGTGVGKLFGLIPALVVYGLGLGGATVLSAIATVRSHQSRKARLEYQRTGPVSPQ